MRLFKSAFLLTLPVSCALFSVAHADIKYTIVAKYTFVKSPDDHSTSTKTNQTIITTTYFVAPEKSRKEYKNSDEIYTSPEVSITRCDLKKQFRLDDALKIYNVSDWSPSDFSAPASDSKLKEDVPESKTVTHYSIRKLASEKVNGLDTECYKVTETNKSNGYGKDREYIAKMKMWVANVQGWPACGEEKIPLSKSHTYVATMPQGRRRFTEENLGDVDEMNKIMDRLPVRQELTTELRDNGADTVTITMHQNLMSYVPNGKLSDSLFEVPTSYREVSSTEYDTLRVKAMLTAIQKTIHVKANP